MNRTVKEATVKAFRHPDLESLKARVLAFVPACNFAKHLKALRWRTPFEAVCHAWTTTPDIFKLNPRHLIPGPNSGARTRLWLEIKASVYGCPILVTETEECGVLGCAMLAGTGIGLYPGLASAAVRLVRFGDEVQPNPAWSDTYARLAPVFEHAYQNSETYWTTLEAAEAATARTS